MKMMTERLMQKTWNSLTNELSHLNDFQSQDGFEATFAELCDVIGDGSASFVCRKRSNRKFDSWNITLINVEDEAAFESVIAPAIALGE